MSPSRALLALVVVPMGVCSLEIACSSEGDASAPPCAKCLDSGVLPPVTKDAVVVDGSSRPQYVANATDFDGFRGWAMFDLGAHPESDAVHLPGPRKVYINKLPPKGATTFPVGTIIVKTVQADQWQVFGMAKRGASFNAIGAIDWEWFGLALAENGKVTIEWRGGGPPAGTGYGGGSSCNVCHGLARDNDYVWTPALSLASP